MLESDLKAALHYDPETGKFTWLTGRLRGNEAGCINGKGYIQISFKGKKYRAHRLAWFYVYGVWADLVDHKDRIKTHNYLSNLRDASLSVNNHNSEIRIDNTSGCKGVHWFSNCQRWRSSISIDKKLITLGWFTSKEEAISARKKAEINYERN